MSQERFNSISNWFPSRCICLPSSLVYERAEVVKSFGVHRRVLHKFNFTSLQDLNRLLSFLEVRIEQSLLCEKQKFVLVVTPFISLRLMLIALMGTWYMKRRRVPHVEIIKMLFFFLSLVIISLTVGNACCCLHIACLIFNEFHFHSRARWRWRNMIFRFK